ncbi:von Willebrand factor A domain-containing protein 5A-like isoform X2 [Rhinatrema bivittatum]|uniref:von Willebrand factor A domain-containing protein 5A-like isoform X2 n=1 Tax=Rhinatrema bivittatum TaxID=194408 RepID=UPI00112E3911|nr:von Willebrand factor A domain-containing protein 5A-like isoform X2 [Rhinatrema bivittatum]
MVVSRRSLPGWGLFAGSSWLRPRLGTDCREQTLKQGGCDLVPAEPSSVQHRAQPNRVLRDTRLFPVMNPSCGLLTRSKHPVPLKGISVDVQVRGFVADVSATLKYKNEEQNPLEAFFVFPMDSDSAVYSFEALVDGKRIVAEIQEKKKAHQTYEDALAQGQEAFLLEEDESSGDIFSCSVGNLPPGQEAAVTLAFVRELPVEADGAVRFVLPAVLNPRYTPQDVGTANVTAGIPRAPKETLPYTLQLSASLQSPYRISRVQCNCSLTPLQYTKDDKSTAQVSLGSGHQFDRDVELLIYYEEANKPSVCVEAGLPSAEAGSLMSETTAMLSFYPSFPEAEEQSQCREFIFLMDRSGSMESRMDRGDWDGQKSSPMRIDSAKETLLLLLKSLPLGCYFNIFGFGSRFDSFFPKSVEYTQKTMDSALEKVKTMSADLGGTEILQPLKHIYKKAGKPGHPRQLFVFTDGEVGNTKQVISEVSRNADHHRCFAFGIGEGASTALIKGISQAAGGTAEFITGKERMQPKALRSLKAALQPVVKDVSLQWSLPPGLEAALVSRLPNAIFRGQRSIVYVRLKGKTDETTQGLVSLQYTFKDETFKNELQFPLQSERSSRATIHRLAAKSLIADLECGCDTDSEEVKKRILETSLQSGVISSLTAFVAVNKDLNQPIQGPLTRRDIPLPVYGCARPREASLKMYSLYAPPEAQSRFYLIQRDPEPSQDQGPPGPSGGFRKNCKSKMGSHSSARRALSLMGSCFRRRGFVAKPSAFRDTEDASMERPGPAAMDAAQEASPGSPDPPLLRLISLQNADGSWTPSPSLASVFGVSEAELKAKIPEPGLDPTLWATVLAVIWLHAAGAGQREEWELLEAKAVAWVKKRAGPALGDLVGAGNALLKASVDAAVFGP